ncbi:hypothetical protein CV014_22505 [Nostoc sp. CMAA1605]|nr:hypothetical protein [Nostoc sp. CMAA1605]
MYKKDIKFFFPIILIPLHPYNPHIPKPLHPHTPKPLHPHTPKPLHPEKFFSSNVLTSSEKSVNL